MRRLTITIALTALIASLLTFSPPAGAAPADASDLAADCNADGLLEVTGTMRFRGGAGVLTTDCVVTMEPHSKLVLRNVALTSEDSFFVIGRAGNNTKVKVIRSVIDLGSFLQLAPGCCSGDEDIPEQNAKIRVRRSFLRGSSVEVSASTASSNGLVRVRRSTLIATETSTVVRGAHNADVVVTRSHLHAATDLAIQSGVDGRTKVARSTLGGAGIDISGGGICHSRHNTPHVACS